MTHPEHNKAKNITNITYIKLNKAVGKLALRTNYTFENFVAGDVNYLEYNAIMQIAENPGHKYNPFIIYGKSGFGKTHLLQAIASRVRQNNSRLNIVYTTAEGYVNDFLQSIHNKTYIEFKEKYRSADLLLVDDIEFLQKMLGSQTELTHIIDHCLEQKKQIVFSCDRAIDDLNNIKDFFFDRLKNSQSTILHKPDYIVLISILQNIASRYGRFVPEDVLCSLTTKYSNNVQKLESKIIELIALSELTKQDISGELIEKLHIISSE